MPIKQCENCSIAIGGRPKLDDSTRYARVESRRYVLHYKNGASYNHQINICSNCKKTLQDRGWLRKDLGGTSRIIFKNRFAVKANTDRIESLMAGGNYTWQKLRERLNNQYYRA